MPTRSNAISEITRLWLEHRHGCLIRESVSVPVPYALSDIDFVATRADGQPFALPDGTRVGPRLIVETKDEHDWDGTGREFGTALAADVGRMDKHFFIPAREKGVKFTMLREQHFRRAEALFGTADFDRLFVVHAIDPSVLANLQPKLSAARIHWLPVRELIADLVAWYDRHTRRAELRSELIGDVLHLLVGYCGFHPRA